MIGAETKPIRLERDVLDVYKMMPTSDVERLLDHIAWMEDELERVERLQRKTERELKRINAMMKEG